MMTQQQAFDRVWDWFIVQQKPRSFVRMLESTWDYASCKYRGPDGCRCAFGVLLPDELYLPEMEGQNASSLIWTLDPHHEFTIWAKENQEFVEVLQRAHDCLRLDRNTEPGVHFTSNGEEKFLPREVLIEFANRYNLTVPAN